VLGRSEPEPAVSDEQIRDVLHALGVERILDRVGGLATECNWDEALSLDEQQLVACARVVLARPHFAFLDRVGTALRGTQAARLLEVLTREKIAYVVIGEGEPAHEHFDSVLELASDGRWTYDNHSSTTGMDLARS
jgi:putative ATP-binding cassette transporter